MSLSESFLFFIYSFLSLLIKMDPFSAPRAAGMVVAMAGVHSCVFLYMCHQHFLLCFSYTCKKVTQKKHLKGMDTCVNHSFVNYSAVIIPHRSLILYVKGLFGTHKIIYTRETITSEEKCKVLKSTPVD